MILKPYVEREERDRRRVAGRRAEGQMAFFLLERAEFATPWVRALCRGFGCEVDPARPGTLERMGGFALEPGQGSDVRQACRAEVGWCTECPLDLDGRDSAEDAAGEACRRSWQGGDVASDPSGASVLRVGSMCCEVDVKAARRVSKLREAAGHGL